MKLYELATEYAALQTAAEEGADVETALAAVGDDLRVKAQNIAAIFSNMAAEQAACAAEEKRLAARRKASENGEERLREYLRVNMERCGIERIKCATVTLSLQEHASVVVDDIERVPAEYRRTKTEVSADKKAILAAHKQNGECVDGTRVVVNKTLMVR